MAATRGNLGGRRWERRRELFAFDRRHGKRNNYAHKSLWGCVELMEVVRDGSTSRR